MHPTYVRNSQRQRLRLRALRYAIGVAGCYVASGTVVLGADRVRAHRLTVVPDEQPARPSRARTASYTSITLDCGHVTVRPVPPMLSATVLRNLLTHCDECERIQRIKSVALAS